MAAASFPQQQAGCCSLVLRATGWHQGGAQGLGISQRLPPHCRQERVTLTLLAWHAGCTSRSHSLVALCCINGSLLSAFVV